MGAGTSSALPYYGTATGQVAQGYGAGSALTGASLQPLAQGLATANGYNQAAGSNISNAYAGAQSYNAGATGLALAGTQQVNPGQLNTSQYMSPYNDAVVNSTMALLNQNNQQQQSALTGNQIMSGAFGGDRAGLASANLSQQQNLANASVISGLENQNYSQALGAAQQQQGVGLSAAQANRSAYQTGAGQLAAIGQQGYAQGTGTGQAQAALGQNIYGQGLGTAQQVSATGQQLYNQGLGAAAASQSIGQGLYGIGSNNATQYAGLGTGLQAANIAQGTAQLGAGTTQQQTQQAQDTAVYNQFLQQQGYPFQVAQFLANIAEGTGALSGSTTTSQSSAGTTQPQPFFSDERLKENIHVIGKTNDGQPIIRFNYKGSPTTQIGLSAQRVEKKHPEAVGLASGYKTVDYDAATKDSIHKAGGGGLSVANDNVVPVMSNIPTGGGKGSMLQKAAGAPDPDKPAVTIAQVSDFGGSGGNGGDSSGADGYAGGGGVDDPQMDAILAAHQAMYPGSINPAGIGSGTGPRGLQLAQSGAHTLNAPKAPEMMKAPQQPQQTGLGQDIKALNEGIGLGKDAYKTGQGLETAAVGSAPSGTPGSTDYKPGSEGWFGTNGKFGNSGAPANPGTAAAPTGGLATAAPATGDIPAFAPGSSPPASAPPTAITTPGTDPMSGDPIPVADATSGLDASSGMLADAGSADMISDALDFVRRGGRIRRRAAGGAMPYDGDSILPDDLYQPDNTSQLESEQKSMEHSPQQMQQQQSGGSGGGVGDALKGVMSIASAVLPFLARGGRAGFEEGGAPDEIPSDNIVNLIDEKRARGLGTAMPPVTASAPKLEDAVPPMPEPGRDAVLLPKELYAGTPNPAEPVDPAAEVAAAARAEPTPTGLGTAAPTAGAPPLAPSAPRAASGSPPAPQGLATGTQPMQGGPDFNSPQAVKGRMWIQESGNRQFKPDGSPVVSSAGAVGVTQIMPGTGPEAAKLAGLPWDENRWKHDAGYNKALGNAYYDAQYSKFGDPYLAAAAYNAGPGAVQQAMATAQTKGGSYLSYLPQETQDYVAIVSGQQKPMSLNRPADPRSPSAGGDGGGLSAAASTPSAPAAAASSPGFFDKSGFLDRNQREVVTGLTFLGNMLASPSHQLAGAIGGGLAAAAPTYASMSFKQQELGQQQQGITQRNVQMAMTQLAQFRQMRASQLASGQKVDPGLDAQINQLQGIVASGLSSMQTAGGAGAPPTAPAGGPAAPPAAPPAALMAPNPPPVQATPLAPPAGTPAPPSATPGATPTDTNSTAPPPSIEAMSLADPTIRSKMEPEKDPWGLIERGREAIAAGDPSGQGRALMEQGRALMDKYARDGYFIGHDGEKVVLKDQAAYEQARNNVEDNRKLVQAEGPQMAARQNARQQLTAIQRIAEGYRTNGLAWLQTNAASIADAVGMSDLLPKEWDAGAAQAFMKNAYRAVIDQGAKGGANTDAARELLDHSGPNIEMNPKANQHIISQLLGSLDHADKHGQEMVDSLDPSRRAANPYQNRGAFDRDWYAKNDVQKYIDEADKKVAVRGAAPSLPDMKVDHTYILEPGQETEFGFKPGQFDGKSHKFRYVERDGKRGFVPVQ